MNSQAHGFVDLQVNGYDGVDFNDDLLSEERLVAACGALERDGVAGVLATVITSDVEAMEVRIRRIAELRDGNAVIRRRVLGIHVEGPFINGAPGFVGTHPSEATRPADLDVAKRLVDAGGGAVRVITLAPERDPQAAVTKALVRQGIIVAAGHCDPTLRELEGVIDNGLSLFTHLGNGCPSLMERHDNIIQSVLNLSDRLWVSFIADGIHVPFMALRNYLRLVGTDRALIVSDAIAAASRGPGRFTLAGRTIIVDEDLATWDASHTHLMGSAVTIQRAGENLRQHLGLSAEDVERLTRLNPRRVLGFEDR